MSETREVWIDKIKIFACVLVVLGHFYQSMTKANILSITDLYQWFNKTIYYFHVPLFFICSGYLYQKNKVVRTFSSWLKNINIKAITLGFPFFFFSIITWVLKTLFSRSVNSETGKIVDILFVNPIAPYWFLYILFFVFLITPTVKSSKGAVAFIIGAAFLKYIAVIFGESNSFFQIYVINGICQNEIWFVLGMMLTFIDHETIQKKWLGAFTGLLFVMLSILIYKVNNHVLDFGMGLLACLSIIMTFGNGENKLITKISMYTIPVFLMHTIFAAFIRIALTKMRIFSFPIHLLLGLVFSFVGPYVSTRILQKCGLDWIVYPKKHITLKRA